MAVQRDRPYSNFNFLVDLGTGAVEGPEAGFQEVSGIGMEVTGLSKYPNVILKRGVIGSLQLYAWLDQIRNGSQSSLRTVSIQLQNEDHSQVVQTWKLLRARIVKHTSGPFSAVGTAVAIEETAWSCAAGSPAILTSVAGGTRPVRPRNRRRAP